MSKFLHDADDNTKAIAIPWLFSKNSRAKNESFWSQYPATKYLTMTTLPPAKNESCLTNNLV